MIFLAFIPCSWDTIVHRGWFLLSWWSWISWIFTLKFYSSPRYLAKGYCSGMILPWFSVFSFVHILIWNAFWPICPLLSSSISALWYFTTFIWDNFVFRSSPSISFISQLTLPSCEGLLADFTSTLRPSSFFLSFAFLTLLFSPRTFYAIADWEVLAPSFLAIESYFLFHHLTS